MPLYQLGKYVTATITDSKDDFGTEIKFPEKGGTKLGEITAIYRHNDQFVYALSGGWVRFYERNVKPWGSYKPPTLDEFTQKLATDIQNQINGLNRDLIKQRQEIEGLKSGTESYELKSLRETLDEMYKFLSFYADKINWDHGMIKDDQDQDDCSSNFRQYGAKERTGVSYYDRYQREFERPPTYFR